MGYNYWDIVNMIMNMGYSLVNHWDIINGIQWVIYIYISFMVSG